MNADQHPPFVTATKSKTLAFIPKYSIEKTICCINCEDFSPITSPFEPVSEVGPSSSPSQCQLLSTVSSCHPAPAALAQFHILLVKNFKLWHPDSFKCCCKLVALPWSLAWGCTRIYVLFISCKCCNLIGRNS